MELDLKHLVADRDRHGNLRYYVRIKGQPKIRIRERPGTPEFLTAYHAAIQDRAPGPANTGAAKGTMTWLAQAYMRSPHFKGIEKDGQRARASVLEACLAEPLRPGAQETMGMCPISRFTGAHARVLRDRRADMADAANARLKWLSAMFSWAIEERLATSNPIRDVKKIRVAKSGGYHTWIVDEVAIYMKRHPTGTMANLAIHLLLFLGVRRADVCLLGRQHMRDRQLVFKPSKTRKSTGKVLSLPVRPELEAAIKATPTGDLTFLQTSHGRPFASAAGFGNWFRDRCDEAGLKHCTAHGLRKAGATIAAENGATERELMAMYGWETAEEARIYTRAAEQKRLAVSGMKRIILE